MQVRFIRLIDELFQDMPQNRKTLEMKEEIVHNLMEKYHDLVAEGKSEEASFNIAAASVGDINELIGAWGPGKAPEPRFEEERNDSGYANPSSYTWDGAEDSAEEMPPEQARHRWASVTALAAMLMVLSPAPVIFMGRQMGLLLMFCMIAAATGLLVYSYATRRREAEAQEERGTPREMTKEQKKALSSLSGAFWCLTVAVYFVVSFYTRAWHISWIIFLIAAAVSNIVHAYFNLKGK